MDDHNLEESLHQNLYKYTGISSEIRQEYRRQEFLDRQKDKRHKEHDQHRMLSNLEKNTDDVIRSQKNKRILRKNFQYKLMMSEWLLNIPDDLEHQWIVKICPNGFRCLVIAKQQHTICYYQNGCVAKVFKSFLPGGGKNTETTKGSTILDCVYNKATRTIFVLDCIMWNSVTMLDVEAQYRFQWLENKFNEDPNLCTDSTNPTFKLVKSFPANKFAIQENLMETLCINEHIVPYDGIAFYHRNSHYIPGFTPLVGWIPSFALAEKLNVLIDSHHLGKKPQNYTTFEDYLKKIILIRRKRSHRNIRNNKMETDNIFDDNMDDETHMDNSGENYTVEEPDECLEVEDVDIGVEIEEIN